MLPNCLNWKKVKALIVVNLFPGSAPHWKRRGADDPVHPYDQASPPPATGAPAGMAVRLLLPGTNCVKIGLPGKLVLSKRKGLLEVQFS